MKNLFVRNVRSFQTALSANIIRSKRKIDPELTIRLGLSNYRKMLKKQAYSGAETSRLRRSIALFAKSKSRRKLKSIRRGKRPHFPKSLLLFSRFEENRLAAGLRPNRKLTWIPILKRREKEKYKELVLKDFSFIDHPDNTVKLLKEILDFEANAINAQLHFDDKYCEDVAPYLVIAEMWPQLAKVFRNGRMSYSIQKVVETLKLRRDLSMKLPGLKDTDDIWAFPRRARRPAGSSVAKDRDLQPQTREKVSDEFVGTLNQWLIFVTQEFELTKQGKSHFGEIIGELLDNAERHSNLPGKDGGWSTAAFMARREEDGKEVFRCHMGFLSVGASISESLETASIKTRSDINKYLDLHANCGRSRETLRTVLGLQDGITRDISAATNSRGGVGLQEVLRLINALGYSHTGENGPRLTIVSGGSCIQARVPYVIGRVHSETKRRTLWFNDNNDPTEPPDPNFVYDLSSKFPGTVIGVTFVMNKDDLKAVLNANKS